MSIEWRRAGRGQDPTRGRRIAVAVGVAVALSLGPAEVARAVVPLEGGFPAGLARAAQSVGQNIAGAGNFFSTKAQAPDSPDAPEWNIYLVDNPDFRTNLHVFSRGADGVARTGFRIVVSAGRVTVLHDPRATGVDNPDFRPSADLSGFVPPDTPDHAGQAPDGPDFPAGLARAAQSMGQNIVGAGGFFSTKAVAPDGGDVPDWNIYLVDNPDFRTNLHLFTRGADGVTRTGFRIVVGGGLVTVLHDPRATGVDNPDFRPGEDLSAFTPPDGGDISR